VKVRMISSGEAIHVELRKEGTYQLPYEEVSLHLPMGETRSLTINGKPCPLNNDHVYTVSID